MLLAHLTGCSLYYASAVVSPRPVIAWHSCLSVQHRGVPWHAGESQPLQRQRILLGVPAQGAGPRRPDPEGAAQAAAPKLGLGQRQGGRRRSSPTFSEQEGEAGSISCCAAEPGGDVIAFKLPRVSADKGQSSGPSRAGRAQRGEGRAVGAPGSWHRSRSLVPAQPGPALGAAEPPEQPLFLPVNQPGHCCGLASPVFFPG